MSVAEILDAIRRETDAEIERRRAVVEARAEKQRRNGVEQAATVEAEAASARDRAAERSAARIVNRARLESDRLARQAGEDVYQLARTRLEERLRSLRDTGDYPRIFSRQLGEVLADLPDATHLLVDPRDAELANRLAGDLPVVPSLSCWGGFVVANEAGRSINNTFEDRLARADGLLRLVAAGSAGGER